MKEIDIFEGNKLIAKFMNILVIKNSYYNCTNVNWDINEGTGYIGNIHESQLEFNSDWNWLMPCIIKMASMPEYNNFRSGYGWPYCEGNPIGCFSTTTEYDVNLSLEILWKELINFIKWYNKQLNNG